MIGIASASVMPGSTVNATPSRSPSGNRLRSPQDFHRQTHLGPFVSRPEPVHLRRVLPVGRIPHGALVFVQRVRCDDFPRHGFFMAVVEVDAEGAVVERIVERAGVELERHLAAHFEFAGERVGHPTMDLALGVDRPFCRFVFVVAAAFVVTQDLHALVGVRRRLQVGVVGVVVERRVFFVFGCRIGWGAEQQRVGGADRGTGLRAAGAGAERVVEQVIAFDFLADRMPAGGAGRVGEEELLRGHRAARSAGAAAPAATAPSGRRCFRLQFGVEDGRLRFDVVAFARFALGAVELHRDDQLLVVLVAGA